MNWLSSILVLWLVVSLISGLRMGFVYKAGNLIGLIIGLYVASRFTPTIAPWFGGGVGALLSTFFLLLSLTSKLFSIVAWGADKLFSIARLLPFVSTANRMLGGLLSLAISTVFLSSLLYVLSSQSLSTTLQRTVDESSVAARLTSLSIFYKPILSHKLEDYLHL